MSELVPIGPLEAVDAAWDVLDLRTGSGTSAYTYQTVHEAVEAAAPLIVAAELDRLANSIYNSPGLRTHLRDRAAFLRGESVE